MLNLLFVLLATAFVQSSLLGVAASAAAAPAQGPKVFSPEQLQKMQLFFPAYALTDRNGTLGGGGNGPLGALFEREQIEQMGYKFSPDNTFSRGELVAAGYNWKSWDPDRRIRYQLSIVVGKMQDGNYLVEYDHHHNSLQMPARIIGKKPTYLGGIDAPLQSDIHGGKYERWDLKVLPLQESAFFLLSLVLAPVPHGTKDMYDSIFTDAFSFNASNKFERGELVVLKRSDRTWCFGIVLGSVNPGQYSVQVSAEGITKSPMPAALLGKMPKLDFSLTDVHYEEEALAKAAEELTSEKINLPKDIGHVMKPSNPNLRAVKQAIQYDTIEDVKKALGPKKEYLEIADATGYTPLLFAVYLNKPAMVKFLLQQGANREAKMKDGLNAYELAVHLGHVSVLEEL